MASSQTASSGRARRGEVQRGSVSFGKGVLNAEERASFAYESTFAPDAFTTCDHFFVSAAM